MPQTREYHRDRKLRSRYGITSRDFERILKAQGGVCALCGLPFSEYQNGRTSMEPAVDHDHDSGKVRGIIHNLCNKQLIAGLEIISKLAEVGLKVVAGSAVSYLSRYAA